MPNTPRRHADDFDPEVLRLFDQYVHGLIDRRGFLRGAARFAGMFGALGLLDALSPDFASAQQVSPDDARVEITRVQFASPAGYGFGSGYLARPANVSGALPAVLVIHENRGLNPHIEDVARRFALEGFSAFAPDALFPLGGYPGDEDEARRRFAKLDQARTREDFLAAAAMHVRIEGGQQRLGVVGFCYGGSVANHLAAHLPNIAAAAPFYGNPPPLETVPDIEAEMLVVLAGNDERINGAWPAYEQALQAAGTRYQLFQPANTQHGFHNDTTPRYDEVAAKEAWRLTIDLFKRNLR
jgi:carboxymethylenebutenolidase